MSSSLNRRLFPSKSDSDYYMLTSLCSTIDQIITKYFQIRNSISVFDYGCGEHPYKPLFSRIAGSYVAGDIPGNPYADIIFEQNGDVPCEKEAFDLVLSIQVLEHVLNYNGYLQEARRILKKDGIIILSTHGWWTHHPYPHDLWRWTREGLIYLLRGTGFEVIDAYWFLGMLAYSCQLRVQCWKGILENKGVLGRFFFRNISFIYQKFMKLSDKMTPERIGRDNAAVYVVVAKKRNLSMSV